MAVSRKKQEQKTKPIWVRLAKIARVIALLFVLTFGGIFAYLYSHQDAIKGVITKTLNDQLNTEIAVGSIDIDFFSKFPQVSVKFTHVRAQEALEKSEQPLFMFRAIHVRFSVWDLIDQDYTVRKLSFEEGEVNLRVTPSGDVNYKFWKTPSDSSATSTKISLEDMEWNLTRFRYIDEQSDIRVLVFIDQLRVKGDFHETTFDAWAEGEATLEDLTVKSSDLADNIPVNVYGQLNVLDQNVKINAQSVEIAGLPFTVAGEVGGGSQHWTIKNKGAQLVNIVKLVPGKWRPNLKSLQANATAQTAVYVTIEPDLTQADVDAVISGGTLNHAKTKILLTGISGDLHYQYYAKEKAHTNILSAEHLKASSRTGNISLSFNLNNFAAPKISANGQFTIGAGELLDIARPGLASAAGGTLQGNFSYSNQLSSWNDLKENAFVNHTLTGDIAVKNGHLTLANSDIAMKRIGADLHIKNRDLEIERLFAAEGNSEFLIDGTMRDAIYMGKNRPIPFLNIRLQSQRIDLDRIMKWRLPTRGNDKQTGQTYSMNYRVLLDVKQFNLIRFVGLNLAGEIWNDGLKIKGKDFAFKTLGGGVSGRFAWNPTNSGYRFWTKGDLKNINIHKLFNGFKNFGQEWLLAENIYGTGSATIESSMTFNQDMTFLPASLKLITNLSIDHGRLKGYKPLLSLKSIVEESALQDVHFDHLENEIAIENQVINIPKMEIKSTALDLEVMGRHSFDQQIDYSIRLALQDIVGKKKKNKKTDLDNWIVEVETQDKPYIWVHVGCSIENPCLSLDREMVKKGVKAEWKKQGEDIKKIFKPKPEAEKPKDPTKGEIMFEWEEEEPDTNTSK